MYKLCVVEKKSVEQYLLIIIFSSKDKSHWRAYYMDSSSNEVIINEAIECISRIEHGLKFLIKNMSDTDETKEVLVLFKEYATSKANYIEQQLYKAQQGGE